MTSDEILWLLVKIFSECKELRNLIISNLNDFVEEEKFRRLELFIKLLIDEINSNENKKFYPLTV